MKPEARLKPNREIKWGEYFGSLPMLVLIFGIIGALTGGAGCILGIIIAIWGLINTIRGKV